MKRCEDCKWSRIYNSPTLSGELYITCDRRPQGHNGDGKCDFYACKWRKTIQAKIVLFGVVALLIWLALLLSGCTVIKYGDFEYRSFGGKSFDKLEASKLIDGTIKVTVTNYDKEGIPMMIFIPMGIQVGEGRQAVMP